jgi:hypothetical protein
MSETSSWITVGELAHAFAADNNAPPATADLARRTLTCAFENGQVIEHRFATADKLAWEITEGEDKGRHAEEAYFAVKIRDGIYFVDFANHQEHATTISLALDLPQAIVTALIGRLPQESETRATLMERIAQGKELTSVDARFLSGAVDAPFSAETPRHYPTDDLVGRRVEYTYSPTERYEHIYLNERFYTWHCLLGSEKGLADTDRCHYFKLAEDLYLFVWREKIVPTLGVVVVDFAQMRTAGKIFGYDGGDPGKLSNFPVGAHARLRNVTERV